jgi:hypothetical protein
MKIEQGSFPLHLFSDERFRQKPEPCVCAAIAFTKRSIASRLSSVVSNNVQKCYGVDVRPRVA